MNETNNQAIQEVIDEQNQKIEVLGAAIFTLTKQLVMTQQAVINLQRPVLTWGVN